MKRHKSIKQGKIIPNGVKLEPHEYDIVLYFTNLGKDIELIPASHTPYIKSPDFLDGRATMGSKDAKSKLQKAAERLFYRANRQSNNLIIDLRHLAGKDNIVTKTLISCFKTTRRVRNMYIINKTRIHDFYKNNLVFLKNYDTIIPTRAS